MQNAINKAWDFKPWDFAEGDKKITAIATDYYDYPQLYQAGIIYLLTVAGAEFTKISWQDYLVYKNKYSAGSEEYWAEHKRYVFINQLAVTVGQEIVIFGKLRATALSGDSDKMPFSPDSDNYENSGNRSIVLIASAELLASEKFKNITSAKEKEDKGLEDIIKKRISAGLHSEMLKQAKAEIMAAYERAGLKYPYA